MARSHSMRSFVSLVAALAFAGETAARAQDVAPAAAPLAGPSQVVSVNPFTTMFRWFNAEYEHRWTPFATWGASGSFITFDGFDYQNANAIVRYYPQGASLAGFFLGGRGGVYHVSSAGTGANFYGAGFELGYSWLLGPKHNVDISLGAGAERLFGGRLVGASLTIPTIRLVNVGIAF